MKLSHHQNARRVRLGALGTGFLLPVLIALFMTSAGAGSSSPSALAAPPPKNISPPAITGNAQEGQILRATVGRWRPKTVRVAVFSFQWQRCASTGSGCVDVAKASDSIYAVRHGDVGQALRVVVTATNGGLRASASSTSTAPVDPVVIDAPVNTVRPTITGKPLEAAVLTAQSGTWSGKEPIQFQYRWRSCAKLGGSCRDLDRAGQTYTLRSREVDHVLRVLVLAQNSVTTSAALSAPTTSVSGTTPPAAVAPKNTGEPQISGTARVGEALRTTRGTWTGTEPLTFTYQWRRCQGPGKPNASDCARISNAADATYVARPADVGFRLRSQVTATNADGSATATSNPTEVIASARPTATAPKNRGEPRISGTTRVGEVLRTTRGTWTGTEPITYSFRWRRCDGRGQPDASDCAGITNANNASYVLRQADAGFRIRSQVTASNADGSVTATSNPTAVITSATPTNTTEPSVSGSALVGNRLTGNRGAWVGNQPITYAFQWLRCSAGGDNCGEITGATDNEYVVVAADLNRTLRVRVTARNDQGSRSAISNPTAQVRANTPPPPPPGSSIPVSEVPNTARLIVADVRFSPNPVRSRTDPITVRVRVKDTRGFVIRGAVVFMRATPRVTSGVRLPTQADGWVTFQLVPNRNFPQPRSGYNVQFFVKAYRAGDPPLAGIAGYRLVQVRLAR